MREHARDKDTAGFLRAEYGDDLPAFPVTVGHTSTDLSWPKVQRRIAQLIRENRFYTQEEQPVPPDLSGQPITRTGDTITIGNGDTSHEVDITLSDEQWVALQRAIPDSAAIPMPYKVGDTVYLNDKPFEITVIGSSDVQLRDPALAFPIFRAESRENFERLLRQDSRNDPITEFLAANLERTDADLREALTSGLLEQRDKEHIAGYFRENEGNTRVAQRLSETYAGTSNTIELVTGETADFFATTTGFEVDIHDKYEAAGAPGGRKSPLSSAPCMSRSRTAFPMSRFCGSLRIGMILILRQKSHRRNLQHCRPASCARKVEHPSPEKSLP